jgi:hypothetical protein
LGLGLISSAAQAQIVTPLNWQVWNAGIGPHQSVDANVAIPGNGYAHAPQPSLGFSVYELTLPSTVNINGDSMLFEARVKNPASEGGAPAYDLYMHAIGRTSGLQAAFGMFESSGWGAAYAGTTTVYPGAPLVQDLQSWHTVGIQTGGGSMSILYDGATVYSFAYQSSIGELGDFQIGLKGTGTIDWVNVSSNGNLVLQSDMNSPTITVTAVPEPETYAMLLAGLGVLGAASRRKPKQTAAA